MPQSRNRPGHPHQKRAEISASQRVKGRIFWAILFAVFGLIIAFFSAAGNYLVLVIVGIAGAVIGYFIGKSMEKDAVHKA